MADIARADGRKWMVSLHETPVVMDRSAPFLAVTHSQAEVFSVSRPADYRTLNMRRTAWSVMLHCAAIDPHVGTQRLKQVCGFEAQQELPRVEMKRPDT